MEDIDILKVKKTMPFIKKHLIKLELKLEIQREVKPFWIWPSGGKCPHFLEGPGG